MSNILRNQLPQKTKRSPKRFSSSLFRSKYRKQIIYRTDKEMDCFFKSVSADLHNSKVVRGFRRSQHILISIDIYRNRALNLVLLISFFVFFTMCLIDHRDFQTVFPFTLPSIFNNFFSSPSTVEFKNAIIVYSFLYFTFMIAVDRIFTVMRILTKLKYISPYVPRIFFLMYLLLGILSTLIVFGKKFEDGIYLFQLAVFDMVIISIFSFFFLIPMFSLVNYLFGKYKTSFYPDSIIIVNLLDILKLSESVDISILDTNKRNTLINKLEVIAFCFQYPLTKRILQGNDNEINLWTSDTFTEIATYFRDLKKWILTPKIDTANQLRLEISESLLNFSIGNWDSLKRKTPIALSGWSKWKDRIRTLFRIVKTLLMGLTPIAFLFFLQQSPLALTGDLAAYVTAGAYIWAALAALSILDPTYQDKITSLKSIFDMIKGGKP